MQGPVSPKLPAAVAGSLAWLAGTALQLQQPSLWPEPAYLALLAAGTLLVLLGRRRWPWLAAGAAALAFGLAGWRAGERLAEALPAALEGQDLVVTGVVAQMPDVDRQGARFVFDVESARREGRPVALPPRLSLGWYRGFDGVDLLGGPGPDLRAGQRWRFTVRLKQPHGTMNPHGFDLELWLFERGIGAGGSVRSRPGALAEKLDERAGAPFERARQAVRDALFVHVPDAAAAGVLAALAIGDQVAIDRDGWDVFRNTGVAHLMSISGLHVTMFAWVAGGLLGWLWRRSARCMLWLPVPTAARWGGLLAAVAYAVLAGWGLPAQRTVAMIAAVVLLRSLGLRWPLMLVLLVAAALVSALDPWALLQPGFWLSFVAVALLVAAEPVALQMQAPADSGWRARTRAALRRGVQTQAVATVGLAPLSMVFFQQVSLVGFAANLVAIPLVTLLITPLALLGMLLPPLWTVAAAATTALMAYLQVLAGLPLAVWSAAAAPAWAVLAGLLGGLVLLLPLPWSWRWLGLPLMLPLLAPPIERPPPGRYELVAADIGQGTAVLLRTATHLLVYDTGPQVSPEADAGQRVLLPLLRARGEHRVDLLLLSHRDTDHVGGAASLLAGLPVGAISSSLPPDHPLLADAASRGVPQRRCDAGQSWDWDGVHFEVLHPTPQEHAAATQANAVSCVLQVHGQGPSVLLTGDIEAPQEAALLARRTGAMALHADVLLVPHHGSRTSSTPAFIDAVAPAVAVVQAGYRSRYGHPAPDVVARYRERGIALVRSDACGAWTLPAAAEAVDTAVCERQSARRYWHHRPFAGQP